MSIAQGSNLKTEKAYIAGVAVVIKTETGLNTFTAETRYLLKDHLGSLDVETDAAGAVLQRYSFDAPSLARGNSPLGSRPPRAERGQAAHSLPRTTSRM